MCVCGGGGGGGKVLSQQQQQQHTFISLMALILFLKPNAPHVSQTDFKALPGWGMWGWGGVERDRERDGGRGKGERGMEKKKR